MNRHGGHMGQRTFLGEVDYLDSFLSKSVLKTGIYFLVPHFYCLLLPFNVAVRKKITYRHSILLKNIHLILIGIK